MNTPKVDRRSLQEILAEYCNDGWHLFPLKRETKKPAIENNLVEASNDINQLMKWARRFPNCNWAVSLAKSGLVAVDIDAGGLTQWASLVAEFGEPQTLKAQSGSGRGMHFVFKAKPGARYRGRLGKAKSGIDVKHHGYIAVYPSIHPATKRQYIWTRKITPISLPAWLVARIEKPKEERKRETSNQSTNFYRKLVDELKQKSFGYNEWLRLGMALHSAFDGGQDGLDLYLDLTEGVNFAEGDLEKAEEKYRGFKPGGGVDGGTIVHIARELGCSIPSWGLEEDIRDSFSSPIKSVVNVSGLLEVEAGDLDHLPDAAPIDIDDEDEEDERAQARRPEWHIDEAGREWTGNPEFLINELNEMGYAVLRGSGEGTIIRHWLDDNGVGSVKIFKLQDFKVALANYHFKSFEWKPRLREWDTKLTSASDLWLKSSRRKSYTEIVFRPETPPGALNLWSPIPCVAEQGDCRLILDFILDIIAVGDNERSEYLLDWLAHAVQKPAEKSTIVPAIIGDEGTGKGLFTDGILRSIFRNYYCRIDKPGVIKERFNVEQSRKFITVLDEASWRGDVELANIMKSLTGNDTMTVEEKFGGRYTIENYSRYIVTSNEIEAIKIGLTNRRYLVYEISSAQLKSTDYYSKIYDGLQNGRLGNFFFDFLMQRDISHFKPKAFPLHLDTAGDHTKISSLGAVGNFWYDSLFESPQPIFTRGRYLIKRDVYAMFVKYCETTRHYERGVTHRKFWQQTTAVIRGLDDLEHRPREVNREYAYVITPHEFVQRFCETNRIPLPASFDDLALVDDEDFPGEPEGPVGNA